MLTVQNNYDCLHLKKLQKQVTKTFGEDESAVNA
jgi:hypothetical protein